MNENGSGSDANGANGSEADGDGFHRNGHHANGHGSKGGPADGIDANADGSDVNGTGANGRGEHGSDVTGIGVNGGGEHGSDVNGIGVNGGGEHGGGEHGGGEHGGGEHGGGEHGGGEHGGGEHDPADAEQLVEARRAIEAVLLVATDPAPDGLLAQLVELPADTVHALCMELADEYDAQGRGFRLRRVAGGWRYQTNPDQHPYVERFALEGLPNRLSAAALETLSIIAYKQPISRGQIGAIRGVNVDAVLRTLVQRGYVTELGKDDGPGQATLFGTTQFFLERLGLDSTDQLPPLGEFVPSAQVLEALEQTLRIDSSEPIETPGETSPGAAVHGPTFGDEGGGSSDLGVGPSGDGDPTSSGG